jgi:beta-glucosidase
MNRSIVCLLIISSAILTAQGQVYKDQKAPVERRIEDIMKLMTLEEKLNMLAGTGFESKPLDRLGIPSLMMTDGPVGVRWKPSVAFPASIMLAATFDTSLARRYGWALARETKAKGRNTILGPCVNILRVPHGGRNFESYGEDPFLTSRMAVSYIRGVQGEGVVATTKHFAVNNQETDRTTINAVVDKRTLYEIYFPAFKAAVQEAKTEAVMSAYNKLNGPYCSENEMLLNSVLKNEWKFDGLVMSDWGAVHSTEGTAAYGLDLEMPDGKYLSPEKLLPLVSNGTLNEATVNDKVRRMLRVMIRMGYFDRALDIPETNAAEHRAVALDVARAGIVLLKNEKAILPLDAASIRSLAVLGPNAEVLRTGGGGSSMVIPASVESPLEGIKRTFPRASVSFAVGARLPGDVPAIEPKYFFLPDDTTGANGLVGEYFDNKELKGEPKLRRIDKNIEFRWGGERPAEGFGEDHFSVRWTGKLKPALSGTYEITTASDDGIRLYIDGKLLIDHWSDHAVEARMVKVPLEAGRLYDLKVEFYENGGDAVALLGWIKPDENELSAAVEAARKSDQVLLFIGDSHYQESEGFDRPSIDLPENQESLINAIAEVNKNIIVVLHAGAQVNVAPWIDKVKGLLWVFFPGQEGTQAMLDVITGLHNPSGKLPFTVARQWEDYPAFGHFPGSDGTVVYKEGLLVGYRYFDTKKITPVFPFGHGLSYTSFTLSDLKVTPKKNGTIDVSVAIKNIGTTAGAEVIQVYVHDQKPTLFRPEKELKAFARVDLVPGELRTVVLKLDKHAFEYYDDVRNKWTCSAGGYTILAGTSSADTPLTARIR